MRSLRKFLIYLTAYAVMPLAGLLLLEGITRIFAPEDLIRQTYDPRVLDMRDGRFPFVNRAGYRGVVRRSEIAINSQHLLGPELPRDGRPRLLLLGDSVLFAVNLEFEDTPGPVLERMLAGEYAVLNASCIGYCSEHQLAYLNEFGDSLEPDMVVLGYCLNDPMSPNAMNLVGVSSAKAKKWNALLVQTNLFLRKHSLSFIWLKGTLGVEKRQNGYAASIEPLFGDASWDRNREVLREIHAWCEAREIPFMLVVFPHRDQLGLGDFALLPQRRLQELATEFPIVDLTSSVAVEDFTFGDPLHFDRNGIRKSMEVIAQTVNEYAVR